MSKILQKEDFVRVHLVHVGDLKLNDGRIGVTECQQHESCMRLYQMVL